MFFNKKNLSGVMSHDELKKRFDVIFKMLCLLMRSDSERLRELVEEWGDFDNTD